MAAPDPLVDLLSSDTDESVVNALVRSLESRLASPTNMEHSQPLSASSLNSNHISSPSSSSACTGASVTAQIKSVQLSNDTTSVNNSVSLQNAKSVIKDNQLIGINSIIHSASSVSSGSRNVSPLPVTVGLNASSPKPLDSASKQPTHTIRIVTQPQAAANQAVALNQVQYINNSTASPNRPVVNNVGDNQTVASEVKPVFHPNAVSSDTPKIVIKAENSGAGMKREVPSPVPQYVLKQEPVNSHVKSESVQGIQQFAAQSTVKGSPSVLATTVNSQPITQKTNVHIVHSANVSSVKGVTVSSVSPSVITVRSQTPSTQMTVVRPQIVTTHNASSPRPQAATRAPNRMPAAPIRIASSQPSQINIAPRPGTNTITLPPGIVPGPGAVLMKNEQGQIVLVQPGTIPTQVSSAASLPSSSSQKVQYVRHQNSQQGLPRGQIVTLQQPAPGVSQTQTIVRQAIPSPVTAVRPQARVSLPSTIQTVVRNSAPGITSTIGQHPQALTPGQPIAPAAPNPNAHQQQMIENVKKCKNFLSTLIKLASSQPETTVRNVRDLIQGLIDGGVEPEVFTEKLQRELKSSPQPYLVPFLKKSLPLLRQSLISNKMTIDGVRPPPIEVLQQQPVVVAPSAQSGLQTGVIQGQPFKSAPGGSRVQLHPKPLAAQQVVSGPGKPQLTRQVNLMGNIPSTVNTLHNKIIGAHSHSSSPGQAHAHKEKKKFDSLKDDDDINDVATMGGVNLSEESKNILATNAEFIGTQIRSCKDETFLYHHPLLGRISSIAKKYGVSDIPNEVINIISHATQERLRDLVEKLSTIAEQRSEIYKVNDKFETVSDVKSQLKFLEELDVLERKRHEEQEKEMLRRAAKSRSKHEDPEQLKLKQKAKELHQAELEEVRQREANLTALAAIGPRKKRKLDTGDSASGSSSSSTTTNGVGATASRSSLRPRIKRVNLRDMMFLMEQEKSLNKSNNLYKTFLK